MKFGLFTWAVAFIWPIFFFSSTSTSERTDKVVAVDNTPVNGIITSDEYTPTELVQDIFAEGTCDNISNVQSIGNLQGLGYFEGGANVIGLERGVILSTGKILSAKGPNNATDKSGNFNDHSGDIDLNDIAVEDIKDAVGIEFDFVPLDSFVSFRYVFASEEYCEFVGTAYNDVFGFFISGPGISGGFSGNAKNVALLPGSNEFVTINTVNRNHNAAYFIGNETSSGAEACNFPYQYQYQNLIQYDGFTTELTASLKLDPCGTYHIRLVIADVKDNFYDSAVFLEAGSFNLGGKIEVTSVGNPQNGQETLSEGCNDGYFLFERETGASTNFPLSINYYFSSESTAIIGVDYQTPAQTLTIPAGVSSVILPIFALNDNETEPPELLRLVFDIPCACYADSADLFIIDPLPMSLDLPDIYVCQNGFSLASPIIEGGNEPYTYLWSTDETSPEIEVWAGAENEYAVTVFDACGHSASDTAHVSITTIPNAFLSGNDRICAGDTAYFNITFDGIPPWDLRFSINGIEQMPIEDIWESIFELPATQAGIYQIIQFNDQACDGTATGSAELALMEIFANIHLTDVTCFGEADGTINIELSGDNPPFDISWSENFGNATFVENLLANRYFVFAKDTENCENSFEIIINEPPVLEGIQLDCEDFQENKLNLNAIGGTPPYLYSIDNENFTNNNLFSTLNEGGSYGISIQDANGCLLTQEFVMPVLYQNMFELPENLEVILSESHEIPLQLNIPESLIETVNWSPAINLSCTDCLYPIHTALSENTYQVTVFDIFGCMASANISITINPDISIYAPTVFSPNGDHINDFFLPLVNENQVKEVLLFQVFNRWGALMYEAKNFQANANRKGWNGTFHNKLMNNGVYVYLIKFRLIDNSTSIFSGDILLHR